MLWLAFCYMMKPNTRSSTHTSPSFPIQQLLFFSRCRLAARVFKRGRPYNLRLHLAQPTIPLPLRHIPAQTDPVTRVGFTHTLQTAPWAKHMTWSAIPAADGLLCDTAKPICHNLRTAAEGGRIGTSAIGVSHSRLSARIGRKCAIIPRQRHASSPASTTCYAPRVRQIFR